MGVTAALADSRARVSKLDQYFCSSLKCTSHCPLLFPLLLPGMWWLPAAGEQLPGGSLRGDKEGSNIGASALAGGFGAEEDARLLQLAAGQRMNTDARRAVFLAIMGSEDYAEAFDKLNSLPLKVGQRGLCGGGARRVGR